MKGLKALLHTTRGYVDFCRDIAYVLSNVKEKYVQHCPTWGCSRHLPETATACSPPLWPPWTSVEQTEASAVESPRSAEGPSGCEKPPAEEKYDPLEEGPVCIKHMYQRYTDK